MLTTTRARAGRDTRARERRWASDARSASLGQSLMANAIITTVVFLAMHHLRALVRLALVASLAALYLNNPAGTPEPTRRAGSASSPSGEGATGGVTRRTFHDSTWCDF